MRLSGVDLMRMATKFLTEHPGQEVMDRFWSKVDRQTEGCWKWKGSINGYGYGLFCFRGTSWIASRFVWQALNGPAPADMVVDHICNTRSCVRPDHLRILTDKANLLRGTGIAAKCARKTHCNQGHEFTPENTYVWKGTDRHCRTCHRQKANARNAKKRQQSLAC